MLAPDRVKAQVFAHVAIQHKLNPAIAQLIDALHDDIFLQLEARNAIGQQPAAPVIAVINRHLHTLAPQRIRRRQPARTSADDTHRFTALRIGANGLDPALFERRIGDVFFDRSNGHGAMPGLLDHTIALAQAVLRADAATDLGEGIGRLAHLIGFLQPPLGGQAQPVGDIVVQRAMRLAIGHPTLAAPAGLLSRLLRRVLRINLIEISFA